MRQPFYSFRQSLEKQFCIADCTELWFNQECSENNITYLCLVSRVQWLAWLLGDRSVFGLQYVRISGNASCDPLAGSAAVEDLLRDLPERSECDAGLPDRDLPEKTARAGRRKPLNREIMISYLFAWLIAEYHEGGERFSSAAFPYKIRLCGDFSEPGKFAKKTFFGKIEIFSKNACIFPRVMIIYTSRW